MRLFLLVRREDVSGVSGVGVVAEGIEFANGTCIMLWRRQPYNMGIYRSSNALLETHGHDGRTSIKWMDHLFPVSIGELLNEQIQHIESETFAQGSHEPSGISRDDWSREVRQGRFSEDGSQGPARGE